MRQRVSVRWIVAMLLGSSFGLSVSGCQSAEDSNSEPIGQASSALCLLGAPCTATQGDCTGTGTCNSSGQCVVSVWCNDGNPCKTDSCQWNARLLKYTCVNTSVTNGTGCNDGNACTQTDTCQSGVCTGSSPVTCTGTNQCKTCNPSTGTCSVNKTNGTGCNDSNACTQSDTCQSGTCVGSSPVYCSDPCKECNSSSGTCINPASNGTPCNDGDECIGPDSCWSGICYGEYETNCTASDQCHNAGVCDSYSGLCSNPIKTNGTQCNYDSNACTQNDSCQNGVCTVGAAVVCTASDQCHVAGVCNTSTGVCTNPNKTNGTGCNDSNLCTQTDTCQNGTCTGSNPKTCTASDQCHDVGTCNPSTGVCSNPAKTNGTSCSDGNACTTSDTCQAGACTGGPAPNCDDNSACTTDGCSTNSGCTHTTISCDDGNVCTVDGCNTSTGCTHTFASTATACDDNKYCTRSDHCDGAGHCTGADNCEDADLCTEDGCAADGSCYHVNTVTCNGQTQCQQAGYCDGNTGACVYPSKPDGTACDDNLRCTNNDACQAGACHGTAVVCTASNTCHDVGTCDPTSGLCSDPVKPNGTDCDDQNYCSLTSSCQSGTCTGANWITCPEEDCRYAGTCEPSTGNCIKANKPAGTSCTDWNKCNENDQCDGNGNCSGSGTKVCDDNKQCTSNGCVPYTGCEFVPLAPGTPCDDGNHCTANDTCSGEVCNPGVEVRCSDNDPCTVDQCLPASGCNFDAAAPSSTSCDDHDACTVGDHCNGAKACLPGTAVDCNDNDVCTTDGCDHTSGCTHTQISCADGNECTVDTCDAALGCQHTARSCDDGDVCTSDGCDPATGCTHPAVSCDDGNQCTADSCARSIGCVHDMLGTGVGCNDGSLCTAGDHCNGAGQCVAGTVTQCDDGVACTLNNCDPSTGNCLFPPAPAGQSCDDGNGCTSGDHCDGQGKCAGQGCDDGSAVNGYELCVSNSCKPGKMGDPVLPYEEAVIERRLGAGRHPVAVSSNRMAVAFVELMKDTEAAPRIGVATFDHFGAPKGAGRFDASVIDSGPVIAGLPDGGFALAYTSMGEQGGDGLDIVLRPVSADGVVGPTKVIANHIKTLGQRAPDIVWAEDHLVVGWEDESVAGIRQVCWREFSDKLAPLGAPECDGDKATASSLTLAAWGTQVAKAWRKEGAIVPSVEVSVPHGRRSIPLADASMTGAPALAAVGAEWLVVFTEGCGTQKAEMVSDTGDGIELQTGASERYEPSLAVTQAGIYLSWREPAQFVGGLWDSKLDEVYLQQLTWADSALTPLANHTMPAGTALLQGDQANAAIVAVPITDGGALLAAWEDWNPNVSGHSNHGDVLVSLIVTPVVR